MAQITYNTFSPCMTTLKKGPETSAQVRNLTLDDRKNIMLTTGQFKKNGRLDFITLVLKQI